MSRPSDPAPPSDPVRPADDSARSMAHSLITGATTAVLAVVAPGRAVPSISRIAWSPAPDGGGLSLVSDLSAHTAILRRNPRCAILVGDVLDRGDPMNHPRLSLVATAEFVGPDAQARPALRSHWLALHPKSKLYVDFADFSFLRFHLESGALNGGFGKAFALSPDDLRIP